MKNVCNHAHVRMRSQKPIISDLYRPSSNHDYVTKATVTNIVAHITST